MKDERVIQLLNGSYYPFKSRNIDFALSAGCLEDHMDALITALICGDHKTAGVILRASITEFWEYEAECQAAMEYTRSLG